MIQLVQSSIYICRNIDRWNTPRCRAPKYITAIIRNLSGFQKPDRFPGTSDDLARVVSRIEAMQTDITGTYADWRNLGFVLADELGESGRDYFHRLSRFYPKYAYTNCNGQFDQCLKSKGHGITIKTLFHMAKQAAPVLTAFLTRDRKRETGGRRRRCG